MTTNKSAQFEKHRGWGAFGVRDLDDIIWKLNWEIQSLEANEDSITGPCQSEKVAEFIAFNCAITACHAVDWAWEALQQKAKIKTNYKDSAAFRDKIFSECKSLSICRTICNTSKHAAPRRPFIKCCGVFTLINDEPECRICKFSLVIKERNNERNAVDIFKESGRFLVNKFLKLQLLERIEEDDNLFQ